MKTNSLKSIKTLFLSVLEHGIKPCFLIVFAIMLNGCGNKEMAELKRYTKSTLAKPGRPVEPLPPIKPFVRYLYTAEKEGLRDPFEPFFFGISGGEASETLEDNGQDRYTQEILTHNKEELEYFELDSLRMVGTLEESGKLWGIIKDQDGLIYKVSKGNYMGRNFGKVNTINEGEIRLREIIQGPNGKWAERTAKLSLEGE